MKTPRLLTLLAALLSTMTAWAGPRRLRARYYLESLNIFD